MPFSRIHENIQRYDKLIKDILDPKLNTSDISNRFWYNSPSLHPWNHWMRKQTRPQSSNTYADIRDFRIDLDVQNFEYSDLEVKVVDDFVIVEGKHKERPDEYGYIMRHFRRKFKLPKGVVSEQLISNLSSDGILSLTAPTTKYHHVDERTDAIGPIAIITEPK